MTAIKIPDAVFAASIVIVDIRAFEPHANHITLFLARRPERRVADRRIAHIGRVIERVGQM